MAKGNRTINIYENDVWKNVFFDSVGTYVNVINQELSSNYKLEPLSNYIKIGGGYAFKTVEYRKSGVPIIRISDFNNEKVDISNCVYYDENESLSKYELKEDDIIICLTGGTIAKLGIVQTGLGKLYMNQRVGRFDILDNSKFEKEYVYWIARSVQSIIKNLAWGAAIPNVSPKQIEKIKFSFPPIRVQQQIIEFLNDLKNETIQEKVYFNERIENHIVALQNNNVSLKDVNSELTHQLDLVKQLRQSFLREAMQGKLVSAVTSSAVETQETGQKLLEKIKAKKAQLIVEKKIKKEKPLTPITEDEIPFEIPEDWAWCRLGEICGFITKGTTPSLEKIKLDEEIPFLKVYNIVGQKINFNYKPQFIDEYTHKNTLSRSIVYPKDVLMNIVGPPLCKVAIVPDSYPEWNINQALAIFRPLQININKFLYYYVCEGSEIKKLIPLGVVGQDNLSLEQCRNLKFPLPPIHEQEQIVAKLEELMGFCDGLEQSIKESRGYNEMLLQQVLREALQGEETN
jgi:type I restriction enzyme S subunit